jgi:UDP-glucose 4-epimerase
MHLSRPKTLVTGGAGFVGGHLLDALIASDHEVLVIDNFFAGRREHVPAGAELVEMDLGKVEEERAFREIREFAPDYAVHLAAIHHIPYCLAHPGETFQSNVRSTDIVVRALDGLPTRKIIAASTADVYPNTDTVHVETELPAPSNSYGLSKLLTEEIVACGVRTNLSLSGVVLRFFNIYGTRETNSHVIPRIIELLRDASAPEIRMGYLGGTRDFVHVADVVGAILAALQFDGERFEVFNVGTGTPTSVRRVLELLMQAAGDDREIIEDQARFRPFDRKSLTAGISKITTTLNWSPLRKVEDGLAPLLTEERPTGAIA